MNPSLIDLITALQALRAQRREKHGPHYYCFSTPLWVRRAITRDYGYPDLDVCASHNKQFGTKFYTPEQNGLVQNWAKDSRKGFAWCNPPYDADGFLLDWVHKCHREVKQGCEKVICMLPLWRKYLWLDYALAHAEIRFSRKPIILFGFGPMRGSKAGNTHWSNEYETIFAIFTKNGTGRCGDWLKP
jgi:hypothetical protein